MIVRMTLDLVESGIENFLSEQLESGGDRNSHQCNNNAEQRTPDEDRDHGDAVVVLGVSVTEAHIFRCRRLAVQVPR